MKEALAMLDAFAGVGVRSFNVTLTDLHGVKLETNGFRRNRGLGELRRNVAAQVKDATRRQVNVIIRPLAAPATLIQLDDLDVETTARIEPHAFLVIRTSPGNHQAWVAVRDAPPDFGRRLRKGAGADPTASGSTRLAGSLNFKTKYAPAFPLVTITHENPGHVVTAAALDRQGLVAEIEEPRHPPRRVSPSSDGRRRWPSYQLCVKGAPKNHQGDRPDISRADFVFCMTAIDWGRDVEETAQRLMEESTKAQENGERYALLTAQNAAVAVERRRQPGQIPRPA